MSPLNGSQMISFLRQFKTRMGSLWWYSAVHFVFSRISDLINLYIGAFLVPAAISSDSLGAVLPLVNLMGFVAIPMSLLLNVVLKYMNSFKVEGEDGMIKAFFHDIQVVAMILSLLLVASLWIAHGFIEPRLRVSDRGVMWMLSGLCVTACFFPLLTTMAQALMRFRGFILSTAIGSIARLATLLLLLKPFQLTGYMAGFLVHQLVAMSFVAWSLRDILRLEVRPASYRQHRPRMWQYFWKAGIPALVIGLAAILEPFVIRNFTPSMDSAGYYIACVFGQIPFYLSLAITPFLFPIVSERFEQGRHTGDILVQTMAVMLCGGGVASLAFAIGGGYLLQLRGDWLTYVGYAPLIAKVAIINTLQSVVFTYVTHENACNRFRYARFLLPVIIGEIVLLYAFMGWGFFKTFLSPDVWGRIDGFLSPRLDFAIWFMLGTRCLLAVFAFRYALGDRNRSGCPEAVGR